jgi:hypothetical protein
MMKLFRIHSTIKILSSTLQTSLEISNHSNTINYICLLLQNTFLPFKLIFKLNKDKKYQFCFLYKNYHNE